MTRARHGFVSLLAIAMMTLVGVALLAMGSALHHEHQRTRQARAEAQLRQVLLAGEAWIAQRLETWSATSPATGQLVSHEFPLPQSLLEQGVSTRLTLEWESNRATARLAASLDGFPLDQTLVYARSAGGWRLREASLDR